MPQVHEEEGYKRSLHCGDQDRDDDVRRTEVETGGGDGNDGQNQQSDENREIGFPIAAIVVRVSVGVIAHEFRLSNQVQQREEVDPDQIDQVPKQADQIDGRVVTRSKMAFDRADQ